MPSAQKDVYYYTLTPIYPPQATSNKQALHQYATARLLASVGAVLFSVQTPKQLQVPMKPKAVKLAAKGATK